jgi:muramoyltetrapeptide carboxypeptidase
MDRMPRSAAPWQAPRFICTITPGWTIKRKKDFLAGVRNLEKLGLRIQNKKFLSRPPSLSAKVEQIHRAFLHPRVQIILAQRGGYGSFKLLPRLNFSLIRRNPKIFAGFSDLSPLLNVIYERTGLVTLHSPMVINFSSPSQITVRSFLNALKGFPEKNLLQGVPVETHRPGVGRGILKGGNLITLTALLATPWEIQTDGAILFLEDVNEKLYQVDRNLTHWIMAGKFKKIRGLLLGDFQRIPSREVYRILTEQMKVNFPVVHCSAIGHGKNKITLPIGAKVELHTSKESLTLL